MRVIRILRDCDEVGTGSQSREQNPLRHTAANNAHHSGSLPPDTLGYSEYSQIPESDP